MGRPVKNTVEYFSHDTDASKRRTLKILFNHFGHEGISAWWQLLERIGDSENHFIDIRNPEDLEFLAAEMRFQPERLTEIFKEMAYLDAIDKKLYSYGIIWIQHFVDRLDAVYKKRELPLPLKPTLLDPPKGLPLAETPLTVSETPFPLSEKHNSIVKESKVKKSIEEKSNAANSANSSDNYSVSLRELVKTFEDCGGAIVTPMIAQQLADIDREYGSDIVIAAFKKAAGNGKKGISLLNYCRPIFEQYKLEGIPNSNSHSKNYSTPHKKFKSAPDDIWRDNNANS